MRNRSDFPDKHRPRRISEIYGQQDITKVIACGIDDGSLPNAMMFHGPSGTGKTTIARIIGMGLNCENGRSSEPCGKCNSCKKVINDSHLAYFELNSANVTGIDYMRKFRENFAQGQWIHLNIKSSSLMNAIGCPQKLRPCF